MSLYGKKNLIELPNIKDRSDATEENETNLEDDDADLSTDGSKTHNFNENAYKEDGVREILLDEKSMISKTNKATFYLDLKPTSPGDGTVCYQSGQDARASTRSPKETFIINDYEHSASYDNTDVQLNTIYCIANIVDTIKKNC